ncbi:MAG: hypothetical protein ACOC3V_00500 [bacterium]
MQDKISNAFINWKRRIHDYKIKESGTEHNVIRIKAEINQYGDATEWDIVSYDTITVSLLLPSEIPMTRLRQSVTDEVASTENVFLFDILPIVGTAKFEDHVEKDDFLIHKIYTDNSNDEYYFILRVSEIIGNISHKQLVKKSFNCAPYNGSMPQEVQDLIDSYVEVDE